MPQEQAQAYCKTCKRKTLHARERFSDAMGCLLTVLTGGLFFPVWVLVVLTQKRNPWRCQVCGQARR